ncbi:hypothetical protein Vadar_016435 [Vaccinium darrowii]|uniref:Uncharacterized protein n=1 Tax=Vaccinium darrowii TaxID=229202 RepID=A0ACB7Y093_9ERIC|nr:hypothetical protein Vadar_016435 [Vaccinium darrowii]
MVITLGSTELGRAWRLEKELKILESNLSTIHAVLLDAEAMGDAVKDWLTKLKDSAYDVEDVMDEIAIEVLKQKRNSQRGLLH